MSYNITDIQELAHLYKGKCLSKEYINSSSPLKWKCSKGHTWDAVYSIILNGGWCHQCLRDQVKEEYLEEINQIAKSKGGKCLSDKYENNHTHLKFQCANGHIWLAKSNNIKTGWWCAQCSQKSKLTLDVFQKLAEAKGGKCLSLSYKRNHDKLKWQCDKGHQWEATANSVKNRNTWCPVCTHSIKYTIGKMHEVARARGGKCLSTVYNNIFEKLKWECHKKHQWSAEAHSVLKGSWCSTCFYNRNKKEK